MKTLFSKSFFVWIFLSVLMGCTTETEPISYGKDICSFCKMTIMDKKFGTELVTKKGKIFKFDDVGCMIKYMKTSSTEESNCQHLVLNSFEKPGEFIPFEKAFFIKSENLKSPMLGNIAAFSLEAEAMKLSKTDSVAKNIVWTELKDLF
jgi:copper chaperone NosL